VFAATGSPPFGEDTLPAIINRILHNEPQLGDLPQPLRSIVYGCLAKDPRNRPTMRDVLLRLLGGRERPPAPKRRAGRVPLVAGIAGAVAASLAVIVVWTASSVGEAGPRTLAADSAGAVTPLRTPAKSRTSKPTKSRTPSANRVTPRPTRTRPPAKERTTTPAPERTATPAPEHTTRRPSRTPSTSRPAPSEPASSASFTLAYVRSQGMSKIIGSGLDCFVGSMNFGVGVDSTKPAAPYSYQWIFNGKVIESGSSRLPAGSRSDYVTSKETIQPPDGTHTVTYRITSPVARSKSLTFTMCPTEP
jgi:serine/threonine protein kinase